MVRTLEVASSEDSGLTDVSLDVSTSAEDAPSRSRSWAGRLLLVAAPFCVVAFGYIGAQTAREGPGRTGKDAKKIDSNSSALMKGGMFSIMNEGTGFLIKQDNLYVASLAAHQCLTGDQLGQSKEIFLDVVPWQKNVSKPESLYWEMVATSLQDFFPSRMHFVPVSDATRTLQYWPGSIPAKQGGWFKTLVTEAEAERPETTTLSCLRSSRAVDRVRLRRIAMGVLLGSAFGRPDPSARKWTSAAASVFGAWFGTPRSPAEGAAGWLASELLEGRVLSDEEPLVLSWELQERVAGMEEEERRVFLSNLRPGLHGGEDKKAVSAYDVIVPLYRLVQELTKSNVVTILGFDEVFTGNELEHLFARSASPEQKKDVPAKLVAAAVAAADDPSAVLRRSGPRFLLRCLLLLEDRERGRYEGDGVEGDGVEGENRFAGAGAGAGKDVSDDEAAAIFLRNNLKGVLSTELLPALKGSQLKVWRGGPVDFYGIFSWVIFRPDDDPGEGFRLTNLLDFFTHGVMLEQKLEQE